MFIVAILHGIEESHGVLQVIFDKINVWGYEHFRVGDLKIINLQAGIQSHSCLHPCYACHASKEELGDFNDIDYEPRTIQSLIDNQQAFQSTSGKHKDLKKFFNVQSPQLITNKEYQFHKDVLDFIPPPELHLLLSLNTLYSHLCKILTLPIAEQWPQKVLCTQKPYHGGEFVGNDCSRLLEGLGDLEQVAADNNCSLQVVPFLRAFRALREVKLATFGHELRSDFKEVCAEFHAAILGLTDPDFGVSFTPKFHIIFKHVPEWCERFNSGTCLKIM